MEIDLPTSTKDDPAGKDESKGKEQECEQEKTIKVHPLAIINVSDHHTRVTSGGSPGGSSASVIGLLFGYQENLTIHIMDSIEMEDSSFSGENEQFFIKQNIELHQTVFSKQDVIGWYRASTSEEDDSPTDKDLKMTNVAIREYNENPLFLFVTSTSDTHNNQVKEELQLPIRIYETFVETQNEDVHPRPIFRKLDFILDTYEPERIAVEKVFYTQPSLSSMQTSAAASAKAKKTTPFPPSALDHQFQSLTSSLQSLDSRLSVIISYLVDLSNRQIQPEDYRYLRHIDSLLRQYPPLPMKQFHKEFQEDYEDVLLLSSCASVAKTVNALQGYIDKFRMVYEKRDLKRGGF